MQVIINEIDFIYFGNNIRLDIFLFEKLSNEMSRTKISSLIENGMISIDGIIVNKKSTLLKSNCKIIISNVIKKIDFQSNFQANIDIVFENDDLLIVNKQKGLSVHEGAGNRERTLVNALISHFKDRIEFSKIERFGIVHRLDKNTTGLIIIAKNNQSHRFLSEMIKNRQIEKKYHAICHGIPCPSSGTIRTYIERDKKNITKMIIVDKDNIGKKSKIAITHYKVEKVLHNGAFSLVEFTLETGRTHQIRLHSLYIKHPIVGDPIYDNLKYRYYNKKNPKESAILREQIEKINSQMLHAYSLKFQDLHIVKESSFVIDQNSYIFKDC